MSGKRLKTIFKISFIPYGLVLLSGIASAVFGIGFFFDTVYGFDGFTLGVTAAVLDMCYIPIIPICIIYQAAYILIPKIISLGKILINALRNFSIKKHGPILVFIAVIIAGAFLSDIINSRMEESVAKPQAEDMIGRAEEKMICGSPVYVPEGIFGIEEAASDMLLIDYDNYEVGLIYHSDRDGYWSEVLTKTDPDDSAVRYIDKNYYVQAEIPLTSPGKRLISFRSHGEGGNHNMIALILETEDGSVYFSDEMLNDDGSMRYSSLGDSDYYVSGLKQLSDLEPLGKAAE